jgi:hypothetical protein
MREEVDADPGALSPTIVEEIVVVVESMKSLP